MVETQLKCTHDSVDDALAQANQICASRGARLTPLRRRVLELLLKNKVPAKAYDLMARLDKDAPAKPPTVYRALSFLLEQGLAHKIESLDAYVACGHQAHGHVAIFLICDHCQSATELHSEEAVKSLMTATAKSEFGLREVIVELKGSCKECSVNKHD